MTIDSNEEWFRVKVNSAWKGRTLYELYKEAYTPWEWHLELKKIAEGYGIPLFSTPFDESAVDFLEKIGVFAYKIASFEIVDLELLKKVASTGKPVIISRGMASLDELILAVSTLKKNGSTQIAILHCVSSYPAIPEEMNLSIIPDIKEKFHTVVGLSDHTLGISAAVASVVFGASIIEKHFTINRATGGLDSAFSLEPAELRELIKTIREVEKAIGQPSYGAGVKESENIIFRRSLFTVKDIKKGEKLTRENVRCIRPGYGLDPKLLPDVLGKSAKINIKRGTPLNLKLII
jgi:pseudaminic acid synthase